MANIIGSIILLSAHEIMQFKKGFTAVPSCP